jgi:hypothetical protein
MHDQAVLLGDPPERRQARGDWPLLELLKRNVIEDRPAL